MRQAAEMHWSYDGNYWFLSNNCAVESLKLLRSGTANPRLNDLDSIMPNGLLAVLKGRGWLTPAYSTTHARRCAWATASTLTATATRPCSRY